MTRQKKKLSKKELKRVAKSYDEALKKLDQEAENDMHAEVEKTTPIKEWLVTYVGEKYKPENNQVDVNMVVKALAEEFPEFLSVLAEQNYMLGYQQALLDMQAKIDQKKKVQSEEKK